MNDEAILSLLLRHDERGLEAALDAYGTRLHTIAARIAGEDAAEECVNDALLAAWNAIPPEQPRSLRAYLYRLARNAALNRYTADRALKRGGGALDAPLTELAECLPAEGDPVREAEQKQLTEAIGRFLQAQKPRERQIFLARYFFAMPLREIAPRFGMEEGAVKSSLRRSRERLRAFLEKEELL